MRNRIREIMCVVFGVVDEDLPENAIYGSFEKWDSLKQMSLLLAIEEEFQIQFTEDEATELLSINLICEMVSRKAEK